MAPFLMSGGNSGWPGDPTRPGGEPPRDLWGTYQGPGQGESPFGDPRQSMSSASATSRVYPYPQNGPGQGGPAQHVGSYHQVPGASSAFQNSRAFEPQAVPYQMYPVAGTAQGQGYPQSTAFPQTGWGEDVLQDHMRGPMLMATGVPSFMPKNDVNVRRAVMNRPEQYQPLAGMPGQVGMNFARMPGRGGRRKGSGDEDEEDVPAVESSTEAEFTGDDDEMSDNFDTLPNDFVPGKIPERVVASRENRKPVQRDHEEVYKDEEEEGLEEFEEFYDEEGAGGIVERVDQLYLSRVTDNGLEHLLRFQESPPAMCQWIPDTVIQVLPNGNVHLQRFEGGDITDEESSPVPVAHRRESSSGKAELLFRIICKDTVLFYWDFVNDEIINQYFASRKRIDVVLDPARPGSITDIKEPDASLLEEGTAGMGACQIDGVKWLVDCWSKGHGSILADESGLEKNMQLLAFLVYLQRHTEWRGPFMIVVQPETTEKWCNDIENMTDLSYVAYESIENSRAIMREWQFPALDETGKPVQGTFAFNVLLVPYDVFMEDAELLKDIRWEVVALDEGHCIKNVKGKKNKVFSAVSAKHRIIMTGKLIQDNLEELWPLLQFVSPDMFKEADRPAFITKDIDDLTDDEVNVAKDLIAPHVLRRLLNEVGPSTSSNDEHVAFVGLTDVQREVGRLVTLRKSWRLTGIGQKEDAVDMGDETDLLCKVYSHPFLLPEAETYYSRKLHMDNRTELLLHVSTKFQWLDGVLRCLHREGRKVLLFIQRIELLKLVEEFVNARGYTREVLYGSMRDQDKLAAVENFQKGKTFLFLISTVSGSEHFELTAADTAIVFDQNRHTQSDIQTRAHCRRIELAHKVTVLRVSTYQTCEHDLLVRTQRKLRKWLMILASDEVSGIQSGGDGTVLLTPPMIVDSDRGGSLADVMKSISTVVDNFSLDRLAVLEAALQAQPEERATTSNREFIEGFPVILNADPRHVIRNRSGEMTIEAAAARAIYRNFERFGVGKWNEISESLDNMFSSEQIHRFCLMLVALSFRALRPTLVTYFPALMTKVIDDLKAQDIYVTPEDLICSTRQGWSQPFSDGFALAVEVDACRKIRPAISEDPFTFLTIIEIRLIASYWSNYGSRSTFKWSQVAPPFSEDDHVIFTMITGGIEFELGPRVHAIADEIKAELISARLSDVYTAVTPYWTEVEFSNVMHVLRNFTADIEDEREFHARTGLLGKKSADVIAFVRSFLGQLEKRQRGRGVTIPDSRTHCQRAPADDARPVTGSWKQVGAKHCDEIAARMELISLIRAKASSLGSPDKTDEWSDYYTQRFLRLILRFGVDSMKDLLLDTRFGFAPFLSESDRLFLEGKRKKRNIQASTLPDYLFNLEDMLDYCGGEISALRAALVTTHARPDKRHTQRKPGQEQELGPAEDRRLRKTIHRSESTDSLDFYDEEEDVAQSQSDEDYHQ